MVKGECKCEICGFIHGIGNLGMCTCATIGLPCQPFVSLRDAEAGGIRTSSPEKHPDYVTVNEGTFAYALLRQPKIIVIEEVCDMLRLMKSSTAGVTYLYKLLCQLAQAGYETTVLKLDHNIWVEMNRKRIA